MSPRSKGALGGERERENHMSSERNKTGMRHRCRKENDICTEHTRERKNERDDAKVKKKGKLQGEKSIRPFVKMSGGFSLETADL